MGGFQLWLTDRKLDFKWSLILGFLQTLQNILRPTVFSPILVWSLFLRIQICNIINLMILILKFPVQFFRITILIGLCQPIEYDKWRYVIFFLGNLKWFLICVICRFPKAITKYRELTILSLVYSSGPVVW